MLQVGKYKTQIQICTMQKICKLGFKMKDYLIFKSNLLP